MRGNRLRSIVPSFAKVVAQAPGFGEYQAKTDRVILVVRLDQHNYNRVVIVGKQGGGPIARRLLLWERRVVVIETTGQILS